MILIVIYNFGSNTNIYKDISYNQSYTLNNEYNQSYTLNNEYNDNKYINEYNDNKYINEYNEYNDNIKYTQSPFLLNKITPSKRSRIQPLSYNNISPFLLTNDILSGDNVNDINNFNLYNNTLQSECKDISEFNNISECKCMYSDSSSYFTRSKCKIDCSNDYSKPCNEYYKECISDSNTCVNKYRHNKKRKIQKDD